MTSGWSNTARKRSRAFKLVYAFRDVITSQLNLKKCQLESNVFALAYLCLSITIDGS